ncbi:hypothetical protein HPDFL43_17610 [Hoeflea phototrophica DFL-43]|uniref:Uncharacterized protein n=1 Tax=Hoeflea phototrophica (strain DSM 17068 / NCIMB 14078 / DFL-43) TaxID=411684 RepID=A9DFS6_HOEPD|nr:hypothetical protein [Hoeflea phototrophica]EDQ31658.1 hypothetical protein HPDFL43_17610 [Hoeflea phototrophica DFL-43]
MGQGRTSDSDRYYNQASLFEALEKLESLWPRLTRSESDLSKHSARKLNPLWIADSAGGHVGVRVAILATHLIYRYATSEILKISDLKDLRDYPALDDELLRKEGISESVNDFKNAIAPLASENEKNIRRYDPKRDRLAFVCFASRAKQTLDKARGIQQEPKTAISDAVALYDRIVKAHCKTANEVFSIISTTWLEGLSYLAPKGDVEAIAKKQPPDPSNALHFIPPKLAEYLPPSGRFHGNRNPRELSDMAELVLQQFRHARARLAVISGKVNAGKSGCVVEFLRALYSSDNTTIGLSLSFGSKSSEGTLPVFTVSVQDYTGYELLLHVLAFLSRLEMPARDRRKSTFERCVAELRNEYGTEPGAEELQRIKQRIRNLHRDNPAVFILTNWEDLTWSTPRAQLRDQSKASLIELLHDSNETSRFLVTTTDVPTARSEQSLPAFELYDVEDPRLKDIIRYLPDLQYPSCYEEELFAAAKRMNKVAIPGDHLILFAGALELCRGDPEWGARANDTLRQLSPEQYLTLSKPAAHQFVRLLVERLHNRDLFRIVVAIAASDDGLRPSSLQRLMSNWDSDTGRSLQRKGSQINAGLEELEGLANSFFLRCRMIKPISALQFDPTERGIAGEASWETYESLRKTLISALTAHGEQDWAAPFTRLLREGMRHIARLAFNRAQEWRCRTVLSNLTPRWQDLLLDIQAYETLLASIDPADLTDNNRNADQVSANPLLHHSVEAVFTCGNGHSAAVAIRFAVQILLLETVDQDNQMSMCYDQDLMRMRLYMLPFVGVGRRHFDRLDDMEYEALPSSFPEWLETIFSVEEIFCLLEAVAISALHAQVPHVVRWAWVRTEELIERLVDRGIDRTDLIARVARIYCSTVDMAIQLGKPLIQNGSRDDTRNGHELTLRQVEDFIAGEFPEFGKETPIPAEFDLSITRKRNHIEAIKRIEVRRAQLLGLTGQLQKAQEELKNIHTWDSALARSNSFGHARILQGRPARVALHIMMRDFILSKNDMQMPDERSRRVLGMLSANASRLARFGGAEQAALLIDRSRFAFVNGNIDLAMQYALEARQFCEDNRVSYGMQIQILLNLVAILIEASEVARSDAANDRLANRATMENAQRDVDAVYQTANALGLRPTEGIALYLKVRLQYIRTLHYPSEGLTSGKLRAATKDISLAIQIMKSCGDVSYRHAMEELRGSLQQLTPI